jgi:hypothetical protein
MDSSVLLTHILAFKSSTTLYRSIMKTGNRDWLNEEDHGAVYKTVYKDGI